jgi:hypothetical protein
MKKVSILISVILITSIISCGNLSKTKNSIKEEITTEEQNNDLNNEKEIPDAKIMNEQLPVTNGIFANASIDDDKAVYEIARLIKANIYNKFALSEMIDYPIPVNINNDRVMINNAQEFIDNYDTLINDNVKQAILSLDYESIFSNYQGVMLGDGQIWLGSTDNGLKIIVINN